MASINNQIAKTQRIPDGRYWVDVFEVNRVGFDAWLDWAYKNEVAFVEVTEDFEDRSFVIFIVDGDGTGAPWPNDEHLPPVNLAGSTIKTSADTAQRPDPPKDIPDQIADTFGRIGSGLLVGAVVLGVVGIIVSARRS
jgi:hypothetical protein